MYAVAGMWLVFDLTGSSFYTGLAGALTLSTKLLQMFTGPIADRFSLRKILAGTQFIQMICVLLVPIAAFTDNLSVFLVIILMPALSILNQFVYPAQSAAIPKIVNEEELVRANSLIAFSYQGSDIAFNAVGGLLIPVIGAIGVYIVDSVTFAIAFAAFVGLKIPSTEVDNSSSKGSDENPVEEYMHDLREGISYIRGSAIVDILFGSLVANFGFAVVIAVLPAFAASIGGPRVYGILFSAIAAGALIGSLGASYLEDLPIGQIIISTRVLAGLAWVGTLATNNAVILAILVFIGFIPNGFANVLTSSMLQSVVDESFLGRVMAVRSSVSMASMPLGAFLGGLIADALNPSIMLLVMLITSVFIGIYYFLRPRLRALPSVEEANKAALNLG